MSIEPPHEEKRFWIGQNIFVAMAGAGFFVVFEHPFWGTVLMLGGVAGLLYSIRERLRQPTSSSAIWLTALLITWVAIGYDYYDRHNTASPIHFKPSKGETVYAKHFLNQEVELDNKFFDECTFENVTFVYHGTAPAGFKNTRANIDAPLKGKIALRTDNDAAKMYSQLQNGLIKSVRFGTFTLNTEDTNGNISPLPLP